MRRSTRRVVVDGCLWMYRIGKHHVTATCVATNERKVIDFATLTGMEWSTVEKGMWKRWFHITPKHIADWLSGKLEKKEHAQHA